jgi:hypothetical protein
MTQSGPIEWDAMEVLAYVSGLQFAKAPKMEFSADWAH